MEVAFGVDYGGRALQTGDISIFTWRLECNTPTGISLLHAVFLKVINTTAEKLSSTGADLLAEIHDTYPISYYSKIVFEIKYNVILAVVFLPL